MSIRHHVRHTAFVAAAVMAISAVPIASAYAGAPGSFQPGDDQLGGGWQVLSQSAPAPAAPPSEPPMIQAAPDPTYAAGPDGYPPARPHRQAQQPNAQQAQVATPPAVAAPSPAPAMVAARPTQATDPIAQAGDVQETPGATYDLVAGTSLENQLRAWAKRAGWSIDWKLQDDWIVPGNSSYGTDFAQAATQVIQQLAENGADVRADIYPGNRALVVHEAGAQ